MSQQTCAVQMVGTITVGASGTASMIPARSNCPFSDLTLAIVPRRVDARYDVTVYFDGEVAETHSFPDANDRVIAHLMYTGMFFPANIGTDVIPIFFQTDRTNYPGETILVEITDTLNEDQEFDVYAIFKEWEHCRFAKLTQES